MALRGTDSESYITEYTLVYEETLLGTARNTVEERLSRHAQKHFFLRPKHQRNVMCVSKINKNVGKLSKRQQNVSKIPAKCQQDVIKILGSA